MTVLDQQIKQDVGVPGFSELELVSLRHFKQSMNDFLPTALPDLQAEGKIVDDSLSSPYDPKFTYLLQNYVLNEDVVKGNQDLTLLREQYLSLSENSRDLIERYSSYFLENDNTTPKSKAEMGQTLVNKVNDVLGGENTNSTPSYSPEEQEYFTEIDGLTTHALAKHLSELKTQNPDIDEEEFNPNVFDKSAHDFMNRLVSKRMDEANVKPNELNMTLIHLWSLQENGSNAPEQGSKEDRLADASSVRDLVGFIANNGTLPNGDTARFGINNSFTGPTYNGAMTDDRFFNRDTYTALMNASEVPASVMFKECDDNPHLGDLKLAAKALDIDTENGVLSQEQVGQMAALMLEYHACKLGIEKQDISAAIHEGRFMPDLDDLRLVEVGLGSPPPLNNGQDMSNRDRFMAEFRNRDATLKFRNERWSEEFGGVTEDEVSRKIKYFHGDDQNNEMLREHIRENYALPTQNYGSARAIIGSTQPTYYEIRRAEYRLGSEEKLKPCVTESEMQPKGSSKPPQDKSDTQMSKTISDFSKVSSDSANDNENALTDAIHDATGQKPGAIPEEKLPDTSDPKIDQNSVLLTSM